MVTKACKLHKLVCKYHGRQFDLQGRFLSMPEFKEVENFPTEADHLHKLPVFSFGKMLFTSLNPSVTPEMLFGEIMERMAWYPMDELQYRPDRTRTFRVKANWALYCENYLEGFHIPFVHQGLNQVLDFGKYTTELFKYANLQMGIAKEGEPSFDLPFNSPDNGKQIAAYYFWVFPNIMLNFYPWGLSLNVVKPIGVAETEVVFYTFVLDESKYDIGAGSDLDTVEMEDEEIVEQVQLGVRSRFYKHGRYSVTREQGTHHFHRLLAEFINPPASK
jgi:choline monooxygenase